MNDYTVKLLKKNVIEVRFKYDSKFEQLILLTADHHWDNPKCDRKLLKKHHNQALERDALIITQGDLFCAMQGKGDRRGSKADVRPEHQKNNYLDALVKTATKWYGPYAKNYIMISDGNHETSVMKFHETDLLNNLVAGLNKKHGTEILKMGYTGWIFWVFEHSGGGKVRTIKQKFNHGYGGGGAVTKGVIQTARRAVYLPDADIITTGHVHERWELDIPRERINQMGEVSISPQWHIQLPTYKEEYLDGGGFHIEKGRPPKPLGGCWLWFYWEQEEIRFRTFWAD